MKIEYTFPEFDEVVIQNIMKGQMPVIIFGFGDVFKKFESEYKKSNVRIEAIIDNNKNIQGTHYNGIEIVSPDKYKNTELFVIICSETYYEYIEKDAIDLGMKNILPYTFLYGGKEFNYELYNKRYRDLIQVQNRRNFIKKLPIDRVIVNSIDITITEKCSLKCRDCSNLMQYYQNPQNADIDIMFKSIDKIMKSVDYVDELRVLGGEPFVSKDFYKYINYLKQFNNYNSIVVYTNATIKPKNENLECLKDKKVFVRMSNYGKISKELEANETLFKNNEILFETLPIENWTDCSGFYCRDRTEEQLEAMFKECCVKKTFVLKDNKFYGCPFAANASTIRIIPSNVDEVIDILEEKNLRQKIKQMNEMKYLKACNYCSGRDFTSAQIPPAAQVRNPIPYKECK